MKANNVPLARCMPRHRVRFVYMLLVMLLAACGQGQQAGAPQASAPAASASVAEAATPAPSATAAASPTTGPTTTPTLAADQFRNPVIDRDFPDPDLLKVGDTYYAYATNASTTNVQTAMSTDLVNWTQLGDALPALPTWAKLQGDLTWAPEVTTWDDGKTFVMYFTTRDAASDKQCIGVATSAKPEGPFTDSGDKPFICPADIGGAIDAATFRDTDGTRYVLWKNDGNCCGYLVHLYIQPVSPDGLTLEGQSAQLITNDQLWEGNLVEAPTLWKHNGKYYLFYSANNYAGLDYAIGYAVADRPAGPYTKTQTVPFVASDLENGAAFGPGGQDVVVDDDGETWLVYHSWDTGITYRRMQIDELMWEGDKPVLEGPDKDPQPKP